MLNYISKHSPIFLMLAATLGFAIPSASALIFPFLPYILFFLMLFTLIGMKQNELIKMLGQLDIWLYASFHAVGLSVLACSIAGLFGASPSLLLAISAVTATGSLFATPAIARSVGLDALAGVANKEPVAVTATPAIARSVGLDALKAMAMTIASTLLMPAVLYVNLLLFQDNNVSLDMQSYIQRLMIFIAGPMLISAMCYRFIPKDLLHRTHAKLSQVTIVLVLTFPFGLVGEFRVIFDQSIMQGLTYLLIGVALCALFFLIGFLFYRHKGLDDSLLSAITAANRNVLLTYTVAGAYLGPEYMALMGAIQLPTYSLPLIVKALSKYLSAPLTQSVKTPK
jgi:BASS family bile acid:Na+ symporter